MLKTKIYDILVKAMAGKVLTYEFDTGEDSGIMQISADALPEITPEEESFLKANEGEYMVDANGNVILVSEE
jgi:hypothetical protein